MNIKETTTGKNNPLYGCANCKRVLSSGQVQPNADQTKGSVCPTCKAPVLAIETRTIMNKARLLYLGLCIVLAVTGVAVLVRNEGKSFNEAGFLITGIMFLGLISAMVVAGYVLHGMGYGFGGGPGWRILSKQEPVVAPAWYRKPSFGAELLREAAISIGILVVALLWYFVMKILKG